MFMFTLNIVGIARRLRRCERGAIAIEFAFAVSALLIYQVPNKQLSASYDIRRVKIANDE